jgi:hypothetical protein
VETGQRIIGHNYVIVQSWPTDEKQMAYDACQMLTNSGVPCTVEKGLPGYLTYAVVTKQGFVRISSPEFAACEKRIMGASGKGFKRFQPTAYKWR